MIIRGKEKHIFSIFFVLLFIVFKDNPFFWDSTQLASLQAHFYYDAHFSTFFLSDTIDSGHPPTLGITLAFLWNIFGRTLIVGHAFMLLFCVGIVYQLYTLCQILFQKYHFWIMLFVLSEATFLAQSSLVSPDICVLFFFILTINGILLQNKWFIFLGNIGLCIVSTRGAMLGGALAIFTGWHWYWSKNFKYNIIYFFLAGFILAITYQMAHYYQKGWILYHPNSPWQQCFEKTNGLGYAKNLLIMAWRFCDNGRILTMVVFFLGVLFYFKKLKKSPIFQMLIFVFLCTALPLLQYKNLLGHRYLLPCYFLINLLICGLILEEKYRYKILIFIIFIIVQISGNFWIYPDKIAKGWDASLAYFSYSKLLKNSSNFITKHAIPKTDIYTCFPLLSSTYHTHLDQDKSTFQEFTSIKNSKYVLYSNIINDFSDPQIDSLNSEGFKTIFADSNYFITFKILVNRNIK